VRAVKINQRDIGVGAGKERALRSKDQMPWPAWST
jgi:hypothetical protein